MLFNFSFVIVFPLFYVMVVMIVCCAVWFPLQLIICITFFIVNRNVSEIQRLADEEDNQLVVNISCSRILEIPLLEGKALLGSKFLLHAFCLLFALDLHAYNAFILFITSFPLNHSRTIDTCNRHLVSFMNLLRMTSFSVHRNPWNYM